VFLRPPFTSWSVFLQRLLHLNVGLLIYGLSVALMVWGAIGLGPWDVFHQGLSLISPLSFGQAMILAGLGVLLFSATVTRVKIGLATVLNMILIGVWADVFLALPGAAPAQNWLLGLLVFGAGVILSGLATGLYITAGLGAGPRDGFVLGISRITGMSVRLSRTLVEVTVLVSGWFMGGSVGVGTLIFALTAGPLMQFFLRLFRPLESRYEAAAAKRLTAQAAEAGKG
jgi:uncharacterized membrane protein YczE